MADENVQDTASTDQKPLKINLMATSSESDSGKNETDAVGASKVGFGFASYSKVNPFLAAAAAAGAVSTSSGFGSFGSISTSSETLENHEGAKSASGSSDSEPKGDSGVSGTVSSVTAGLHSPKSNNPFSSPSPRNNPFVSIVENSSGGYWKSISENEKELSDISKSDDGKKSVTNEKSSVELKEEGELGEAKKTDENKTDSKSADYEYEESDDCGATFKHSAAVFTGASTNGEEGEECLLQVRAKLFRLSVPGPKHGSAPEHSLGAPPAFTIPSANASSPSDDKKNKNAEETKEKRKEESAPSALLTGTKMSQEWIEVGTGPVRILKPRTSASGDARLVMRRENQPGGIGSYFFLTCRGNFPNVCFLLLNLVGTKVILNILLKGQVSVSMLSEKNLVLSCVADKPNSEATPSLSQSYLLKTKLSSVSDELF